MRRREFLTILGSAALISPATGGAADAFPSRWEATNEAESCRTLLPESDWITAQMLTADGGRMDYLSIRYAFRKFCRLGNSRVGS